MRITWIYIVVKCMHLQLCGQRGSEIGSEGFKGDVAGGGGQEVVE